MKILGRSRRINDLDVVFRRELEKPLQASARVLRSHSLESVGQKQNDRTQAVPFVLSAGDELINDHLSSVDEVTELGLPENQAVRTIEAVTVLKTQNSHLRERAVINLYRRLFRSHVLKGYVRMSVLIVIEYSMSVAKGPTGAILSGETHAVTLASKAGEGQRLGCRPVERPFVLGHFAPDPNSAYDLGMRMKIFGKSSLRVKKCRKFLLGNPGIDVGSRRLRPSSIPTPDAA